MEEINRADILLFIGLRLLKQFNTQYFEVLKKDFTLQTGKKESTRVITSEGYEKLKEDIKNFIEDEGLNPNLTLSQLSSLISPFKEDLGTITQLNFLDGFDKKNKLNTAQKQARITQFLKKGSYKPEQTLKRETPNLRTGKTPNPKLESKEAFIGLTQGKTPKLLKNFYLKEKGFNINKSLKEQDEAVINDDYGGLIDPNILEEIVAKYVEEETEGKTEGKSEAKAEAKSEATMGSQEESEEKADTEEEEKPVQKTDQDIAIDKRLKSGQKITKEQEKAIQELEKQREETKKGEGAGLSPSTSTEQIAEQIATNQEGGEATTQEAVPEVQEEAVPEVQEEVQAQPQTQPNVTTEVVRQDQPPEGKENRINIGQQVDDIPKETTLSKIDESRFSTQFKTIAELNADIKYFISNFGNVLGKTLIEEYNKINKQNLAQVRRLHGKMSGVLQTDKKKEVKIGIIIDADEYIREKINMVIAQNATTGLKASGLIINVEGQTEKEGDKSIGNFDVRKARLGGSLAYQREPVYRFIPKSNPTDVDLEERKKPTGRGIQMLGTKRIDLVSTSRRQRANDPFAKSRNPIKLKYIY